MESKQQWFTWLKENLCNSLLVLIMIFGFILLGLKKLVELEFACPCNPLSNGMFSSAFFIIPAIIAFTLMLIIQRCRCDDNCDLSHWITVSLSSFVPALVWLILLFLDGQYFACAMTDWEGRYVLVDKAPLRKWCKPTIEGDDTSQELLLLTQEWFSTSQDIGIGLLAVICGALLVYAIRQCCMKQVEMQDADELTALGESS